jgi:hypothetical protein
MVGLSQPLARHHGRSYRFQARVSNELRDRSKACHPHGTNQKPRGPRRATQALIRITKSLRFRQDAPLELRRRDVMLDRIERL